MNSPKVRDEDDINFIIATPRTVTATEASSSQPESRNRSLARRFYSLATTPRTRPGSAVDGGENAD